MLHSSCAAIADFSVDQISDLVKMFHGSGDLLLNNPALLTGYGSYGITIDPAFMPVMLAWYERGGVFAVAHIRGGGEYGYVTDHRPYVQRSDAVIVYFTATPPPATA